MHFANERNRNYVSIVQPQASDNKWFLVDIKSSFAVVNFYKLDLYSKQLSFFITLNVKKIEPL